METEGCKGWGKLYHTCGISESETVYSHWLVALVQRMWMDECANAFVPIQTQPVT